VGGFGIVGGAPAGGIAGQFNGNVNVVGPLSVSAGNLTMVDSTATAGNILKGGVPFLHNFGTNNTFIGKNAGNLTMTGLGNNTASGSFALANNTNGTANTASGAFALQSNTFGFGNTASGSFALANNTSGDSNTASGVEALQFNTTGDSNTATGVDALRLNTTGSFNTASGVSALFSNTTGTNNTASGRNALFSNTTGSNNTAVGFGANVSLPGNLTNATAIGANALVSASNAMALGNQVSVGIGISAPAFKLHVIDSANTALRVETNALGGTVASFGANGDFRIDRPFIVGGRLIVTENGFVGVFNNAPVATLDVGPGRTTLADAWTIRSSARLKTNIQPILGAVAMVEKLRGVSYDWKASGRHDIGLIAEEVAQVVPEVVSFDSATGQAQGLDYARLTALLIEAVKQQQATAKQQQTEIEKLRSEVERLHSRLNGPATSAGQ
jgi:hypothetical protein